MSTGHVLLNFGQTVRLPIHCRSELAREHRKNTAGCQAASVIVDDPRERARADRASGYRRGQDWFAANCEGATPSSRRNMSLKLLGE